MECAALQRGHFHNSQYLLQINGTAHFANDLGLDSLDVVEAVMAVEEVHNDPIVLRK
jgi:acyl carrier protein